MALYRVYLMDDAEFVQQTAAVECVSDADAVEHARTLIRHGGPVQLWTDDAQPGALIGWFQSQPGPFSAALVRRSRARSASGSHPVLTPLMQSRQMCLA